MNARPVRIPSITRKLKTSCGNLYVTVGFQDEKPIEVFSTLGHEGSCTSCQNEALTRAITVGLRSGVDVEVYIKTFTGIQCPTPYLWPELERILSCPDAIAKVLKEAQC